MGFNRVLISVWVTWDPTLPLRSFLRHCGHGTKGADSGATLSTWKQRWSPCESHPAHCIDDGPRYWTDTGPVDQLTNDPTLVTWHCPKCLLSEHKNGIDIWVQQVFLCTGPFLNFTSGFKRRHWSWWIVSTEDVPCGNTVALVGVDQYILQLGLSWVSGMPAVRTKRIWDTDISMGITPQQNEYCIL